MPAPPLVKSGRLAFLEKNTQIRILLHGLTGPVDNKTYSSIMPPMEANSDEWIAEVVSYIRHEFGGRPPWNYLSKQQPGTAEAPTNKAAGFPVRPTISNVVKPEEVRKIREEEKRTTPWTIEELESKKKEESAPQE
jgi:hypothetical protein